MPEEPTGKVNPILPEARARMEEIKRDRDDAVKRLEVKEERITGRVSEAPDKSTKEALLQETQDILKEYGGLEANIPIHNRYWGLMNELRAVVSKEEF